MSFTPKRISVRTQARSRRLDEWQRRAVLGMVGMVFLSFLASNLWALFWQQSEWLVATILPAVVVDLTNEEREGVAAGNLRRNAVLDAAATQKAEHMAAEGYFAHHSPSGVTPWHWFESVGYDYAHAGENLAVHFTDSSSLVAAWMQSPTHRENIINQQFTEIGVGTARGEYQGYPTVFVVQLFGTPAAAAPAPEPETEAVAAPAPATSTIASATEEATSSPATTVPAVAEQVAGQQVTTTPAAAEEPTEIETSDVAAASATESTEVATTATSTKTATVTPVAGGWQVTGVYSTSSGAPAANTWGSGNQAGTSVAALATQPHRLLQWVYGALSLTVLAMMILALRLEFRRHQYLQMAYSLVLLCLMGGLWYLHSHLTSGAIVV